MDHIKQSEVELLLHHNQPVMLVGESGSGKSTILQKAAVTAKVPYTFIAGTRQTTVGNILGFLSVNGTYVKSTFRKAYEEGHYFNIDEIDAMDANCLLVFNSLENNIIAFPDGYSEPPHKDFRLMSTANPMDSHSSYTGRSKLDLSSLERFDIIDVDRDENLEKRLVDGITYKSITLIRECLKGTNSSTRISMRDTMRYQKRKDLNLLDGFVERLMKKDLLAFEKYEEKKNELPKASNVSECETLGDVWDFIEIMQIKETKLWV